MRYCPHDNTMQMLTPVVRRLHHTCWPAGHQSCCPVTDPGSIGLYFPLSCGDWEYIKHTGDMITCPLRSVQGHLPCHWWWSHLERYFLMLWTQCFPQNHIGSVGDCEASNFVHYAECSCLSEWSVFLRSHLISFHCCIVSLKLGISHYLLFKVFSYNLV